MTSVWREVGDRVWVRRYQSLDQTIGVIGGADGLVVIDTRASHRLADELRGELQQLPGALVAVVNTHGHWDHAFGNARFLPAPIWGHVRCASMITERGAEVRERLMRDQPGEAFGDVELTPPDQLLEDSAVLEIGDRQVQLLHLGRGHTDNDVVITVPDASVLFAGDLLENAPAPGFGDSYPTAWVDTGRALLKLVDGAVVPGHGDPFDRTFAAGQVEELEMLADLARAAVSGAIGLDEAIRRSPFPPAPTATALERARIELTTPETH
ncbi:MAG: MBL fold metallo-hydrolase [Chloroflexota bacterium]|nr:MBL fold metallo-hydrolase [Chloroflexota bacterium]